MKNSIIFASMAIAAGLTLTNIYTSIVDVPSWGSNIPHSIETARQYFSVSNPGNFFRIFSPLNQALGLLCVLFFWNRSKKVRWFLVAAFLLYAAGEAMTFNYFYPRNAILFDSTTADAETLKSVWLEWRNMNWVRSLVIASGFICSSIALNHSYTVIRLRKENKQSPMIQPATALA